MEPNADPLDAVSIDAIAQRAYERWVSRGRRADSSHFDWIEAEAELHQVQGMQCRIQELETRLLGEISKIQRAQSLLSVEHAVGRRLATASTLDEVAPGVLNAICTALDFSIGVLWVVDSAEHVLRCAEVVQSPEFDVSLYVEATRQQTFAIGMGLPGRVWDSDLPLSIADVTVDDGLPRHLIAARVGLHGAVAFPLRNGVEFLGVMEFYTRTIGTLENEVIAMMSSIGGQLSQFIERRRAEATVSCNHQERVLAQRMQQGMLPAKNLEFAGYELSGYCQSATGLSGDCFDYFPMFVGDNECLGILIADACGHSMASALLVAEMRAYVRALSITFPDVEQILQLVNERICDQRVHDGFITALLLRLAPGSGAVVYANAGHCAGMVFDRHGHVRRSLSSTGLPIGIDSASPCPAEAGCELGLGELILLYSDGAVEGIGPCGDLFGVDRLLDAVRAHWHQEADHILEGVFSRIFEFTNNATLNDDVAIVVIKRQ